MTDRHNKSDAVPPTAGLRQEQFLDVISKEEATLRFQRHLTLMPLGEETVLLELALGRVLSQEIVSSVHPAGRPDPPPP